MSPAITNFLNQTASFALEKVLPAVILLVIGIFVVRLLMKGITAALNKTKLEKTAYGLIRSVLRIVLYALLALIIASRLGIDVTGVVALASVLTLAVSLSVQTAMTNLVGGFTLLYNKPFVAGDYVEVAGQSGAVKEVGLTYTKLVTGDNKTISIPNSAVVAAEIVNYSVAGTRRVDIEVSAAYTAPVEQVLEALREAGTVEKVFAEPAPFAAVLNYDDSAIRYALRIWCKGEDYWDVRFQVNENVKKVFDEKGIAMTYPHLNVHLDK